MGRVRVKFCGVMRPEDAAAASQVGADAVGMIFHPPARRNIAVERARSIVAALGPFVTPVGVFVDAPAAQIIQTASTVGLQMIQLNGRETPELLGDLAAASLRVLKAVRVDQTLEEQLAQCRSIIDRFPGVLAGLVLETGNTPHAGGTGLANDWARIAADQASGRFHNLPPLIAAGGLNPDTVESVVRNLQPWAVDVSSGVESSHGVKDRVLMQRFIEGVRRAERPRDSGESGGPVRTA